MQDNRKIKTIESIWEEVGVPYTKEIFLGYIMAHFEQIYLGLRNVVAVNINLFDTQEEGMEFINKCCQQFGCKYVHEDQGEIWVTKQGTLFFADNIPSRLSDNNDDHRNRGKLLNYPETVIESYFLS